MKIAVIALFVFLAVFRVEGQGYNSPTERCLCQGSGLQFIKPKLIKCVQYHLPSTSCPRIEIIVTTTANKMVCLNPEKPFTKMLLHRISRPHNKAVSTSMSPSTVYSSMTPSNNINHTVL